MKFTFTNEPFTPPTLAAAILALQLALRLPSDTDMRLVIGSVTVEVPGDEWNQILDLALKGLKS